MIDKVIQIRSHIITCKQQEEQYRSMQLKNEQIADLLKIHKAVRDKLLEKSLAQLAEEISPLDNEGVERTKLCLNRLAEWMSKGMEIYSSIDTPSEVKALFPTETQQKLSVEDLKLLSDPSFNKSEDE